jgi:hypothetical protein
MATVVEGVGERERVGPAAVLGSVMGCGQHTLTMRGSRPTCPLNIRNECSITCSVMNAQKKDCET